MFPIIPALVLAFVSFIASAFVILRIVIPILPPHPLSKRVSPAEFGLPTFRSLSPADKAHLWLASLDLLALALFIWQIISESTIGPSGLALATDPASAVRLWIVVTIRQTCLLMVAAVTLLHVRMAQSVSFGARHWLLWAPTTLLLVTSTAIAGIVAGAGVDTLFLGLTAYSATIAVLSTVAFICLIRTLFVIKKNLTNLNEPNDSWPPVNTTEKPRPSFGTEDIDALRDGASWITSSAGSRRGSVSAWSFSTHHTAATSQHHGRPQSHLHPSVPAKSSFWFGSTSPEDLHIPPVPPLPSPYGSSTPTAVGLPDPDPFRRDAPAVPHQQKPRFGSQSSWLTSSAGSHTTVTAWSYPTTHHESNTEYGNPSTPDLHASLMVPSRPTTPALADAQVLGGYGYAPEVEKGMTSFATSTGSTVEISMLPAFTWSVMIWIPIGFSLPYMIFHSQYILPTQAIHILFILSVTLSAPILAISLLVGSPLPIPVGLFDTTPNLPVEHRGSVFAGSFPPNKWSHEYKHSTSCSVTVVEGRRSGDVWLSKGDAIDGKGKFGRAVTMLHATPKLSVLPPEEDDGTDMPPIPFQNDDSSLPVHIHGTPNSENSVQFGRLRKESKNSTRTSGGADESVGFASKIMIAQRHYSALAQTVIVPGGNYDSAAPTSNLITASGTNIKRASRSSHIRSRSTSSSVNLRPSTPTDRNTSITPPPPFPLPPTPPNVRAARLALLAHKKSFSSGFSIKEIDDINEIDAMTAGMLPLLVPGLKVGDGMKIKEDEELGTWSKHKGKQMMKALAEFGEDFSSPEVHSTPARTRQRARKVSHKKNHFSLPSLSLGKEGLHSLSTWSQDIRNALETKVGLYTALPNSIEAGRPNTVVGVENWNPPLSAVQEEVAANLGRTTSLRVLGLQADVPHGVDSHRSSIATLSNIPPSAASTVTLFDDFEAGMQSGPQAQSTPHNTVTQKPKSRHSPPPMPDHRRPTIRYIKSDTQASDVAYPIEQPSNNLPNRPALKNTNALERVPSNGSAKGLRQLTLLKDANIVNRPASPTSQIRPLKLSKRQGSRAHGGLQDENGRPVASPKKNKNLKQLTLARSETAKVRGVLRQNEVLPEVVVRPPSTVDNDAHYPIYG